MKKIKIINIVILIFTLLYILTTNIYARTTEEYDDRDTQDHTKHSAGEIIEEAGSFIEKGKTEGDKKIKADDLRDMSTTLYNILLVVGIIVAIIVGLIMGMKFVMGSIEEKAEIKTMLIPYFIGCSVVFGAFTIWQIVVEVLKSA